jgi:saccharopine dehydrogenase-like NADP-dependent oxidoreductase
VADVAQEIIDGLVATRKHEILLFTRKVSPQTRICTTSNRQQDPPPNDPNSGVTWAKTDYLDVKQLTSLLAGIHTVFSFVAPYLDQEEAFNAQKNLIDASIQAGVKRFAPSEWAS